MESVTLLTTREMYSQHNYSPADLAPYVLQDNINLEGKTFYQVLDRMTKERGDIATTIRMMIKQDKLKSLRKVSKRHHSEEVKSKRHPEFASYLNRWGKAMDRASSALEQNSNYLERMAVNYGLTTYNVPVLSITCYQEIEGRDIAIPSRTTGFPYATLGESVKGFLTFVEDSPCLDMVVELLMPTQTL